MTLVEFKNRVNRLWVIGRRSKIAYVRFYPNPGFMLPLWKNKRVRYSKFYGWKITKAPTDSNPRGL
jgi:hypothetical protein